MPAAIVADRGTDGLGDDGAIIREQLLDSLAGQIGRRLKRLVQIRDVGSVMFVMVDLHGHLVDGRLERVGCVGQSWNCEWHVVVSPVVNSDVVNLMLASYEVDALW